MLYDYEYFSLIFDSLCLSASEKDMLKTYQFYDNGLHVRGHVKSDDLYSFIQTFNNTNHFHQCMLDWNYDLILPLQDCYTKSTISNLYPEAWTLDYTDRSINHQYTSNWNHSDNVDLWILDTGVYDQHEEFKHLNVTNYYLNDSSYVISHPHGTGVASAAVGMKYGTAYNKNIYNVPVCKFGASCGSSDIEKGLRLALEHVKQRYNQSKRTVINMSFGTSLGDKNPIETVLGQYYNQLFQEIESYGGVIVVAAGNSNENACHWYYSFSPYVISVGSLDQNYNKSGFSNYGSCIDLWAFGSNVPIAYSITDTKNIQYKSGTSFAAPYVAGLLVNLLTEHIHYSKEELLNVLYSMMKGNIVPLYKCNQTQTQCCQGSIAGTRLDAWCKTFNVYQCQRTCKIKPCT